MATLPKYLRNIWQNSFLDEDEVTNPWLYMHKMLNENEEIAKKIGLRTFYLEVCNCTPIEIPNADMPINAGSQGIRLSAY